MNLFKYPKKPGSVREIASSYSSEMEEDNAAGKLRSVYPSLTDRLQSAQLLNTRGHSSDFKETNQLPMVRVWSGTRRRQVGNLLDFTSQAPRGSEPISNSFIKQNPSPKKPTFISVYPHNQNSKSSKEIQEHNNIQSYPFKHSPAQVNSVTGVGQNVFRGQSDAASWAETQSPFGAQRKSRFISTFNPFTRADPNKQVSEAQIRFGGPRVILYPTPHKAVTPTAAVLHPVSAEIKNWQNLASATHSHSQVSRKTVAPPDQVNATSRESGQEYKQRQSVKRFSRPDGFTNSERKPVQVMSGLSSTDGTRSTTNEGKYVGLRFSKAYPSLSQKYSFGQRRVSGTSATSANLDKVETSSPPPVTRVGRTSAAQPFTSTPNSLEPETGSRINGNNTLNRFRLYKGRFGLEGYGSRPLEGAKAFPQTANAVIIPKPSLKVFEFENSVEVPRPKGIRIHRWYDQRDENEAGSRGDFKTPPNTSRVDGSVPRFTSHQTTTETQTLRGFQPGRNQTDSVQNRISWKYPEHNIVRLSQIASSSNVRSAKQLMGNVSPPPRPRAADGNNPVTEGAARFKIPTSSSVRGKRVKLIQADGRKLIGVIVRNSTRNSVIHRPPRIKAVTYADIVGSASFSSVRAAGQDLDHFPNMTTAQEEGWSSNSADVKNVSQSAEANVTRDQKDEERVEEQEEVDNEVEMSELFFESEGSGGFDSSDGLSTTQNESAGNDLLELDYLRKSTGNISFRSLGKSHLEQR